MFIKNKLALLESLETMLAHQQRMNQISNNLANVDTTGYKRESNTFWEVMIRNQEGLARVGKGVADLVDQGQGRLEPTGNPLDLAISGEGFFRLQGPEGIRYTRSGNFHVNQEGQLTTARGQLVLGESGAIKINGGNVTVSASGRVSVDGTVVDRLQVVRFDDQSRLEKDGRNLFRTAAGQSEAGPAVDSSVQQGFLEGSNVNSIVEMTAMMDLARDYESQQRVITIADDLDDQAIRRVGRLNQ